MVQRRRRIENDQDRFGGFSRQPVSHSVDFDAETENAETPRMTYAETFVDRRKPAEEEVQREPEVVEYSSRSTYPNAAEYAAPITIRKPTKVQRRPKEDFMPTVKTLAYEQSERGVEKSVTKKSSAEVRADAKQKVMLAIYLTVATVLAIAVIAVGIAVSGINGETAELENMIQSRNETLLQQASDIDKYTDLTYIAGKALDNNMEKVDEVREITLPPLKEPIKYESRSNWFDKFCDWLSNLIGG